MSEEASKEEVKEKAAEAEKKDGDAFGATE
jgi:hypothetical protein